MKRLYQYAVLLRPTSAEAREGKDTMVVIPPTDFFLAMSEEEVCMIAARSIPSEYMTDADRLEVAVRSF